MRCEGCPIYGVCVEAVGDPKAAIALVGMNPGKTEANTGVPFTGNSGQLLDASLAEVGLNRDDLFLTNAVLCHLDNADKPTKEMFRLCRGRLMDEIKDAKVVVVFGTEATQSMLGGVGGIMSIVGSMHHLEGKIVLPTFHPAYILRGAVDAYDDLEDTLRRAKGLIDGTVPMPEELPYDRIHYLTDPRWMHKVLTELIQDGPELLAIDTETKTVRDPEYEILLLQLSDGNESWVFEAPNMDQMADDLFRIILKRKRLIFHNAAFDLQVLYHHWGIWADKVEDTMALALCLTEKLGRVGLKRLVNRYLSVPHYEEDIHQYIRSVNDTYDKIPREVLVPYAAFDAYYTYKLFPVLQVEVEKEGNGQLYPLLVDAQKAFAQMSYDGTKVDLEYVDSLRREYYPMRDALVADMQQYAKFEGFDPAKVVKNTKSDLLNPNSPVQLLYFIQQYLRIPASSTDKDFIAKNIEHPFVALLAKYRDLTKLLDTYVDGFADEVWPDGRIHPDFTHGTVTGRLVIKHPAMQVMPGIKAMAEKGLHSIKKLFVASEGHWFVHVDYSQLEMRVAWHITGDDQMGAILQSGDFHRNAAAKIHNKRPEDVTEEERRKSKFVTFGVMYGRGAWSLTFDLKCPLWQAEIYIRNFFAGFPVYHEWWKEMQKNVLDTGVLKTDYGRRRRWKLITPDLEPHIMKEAINFPIQSMASDICLTSMIKLNTILRERSWGKVLFTVHDSIEFEIVKGHLDEACTLIKETMEHPFESVATFPVDLQYGTSMGDVKEWHIGAEASEQSSISVQAI